MPDDGHQQLPIRERMVILETVMETIARDLAKLVVEVEGMRDRLNLAAGGDRITARIDSAVIGVIGGLVGAIVMLALSFLLHH
jgi:hypothetical protein